MTEQMQEQGWGQAREGENPLSGDGDAGVDGHVRQGWWLASDGRWYPPEAQPGPAVPPLPYASIEPAAPYVGTAVSAPRRRAWYARWWSIGLAVFLGLAVLGAAFGEEEPEGGETVAAGSTSPQESVASPEADAPVTTEAAEAEEAEPEPEPEPQAPEGSYGSDDALDRLQDSCADGDASACDDLFMESPLGSEYEAFAEAHGAGDSGLTDSAEFEELVFEVTWSGMSVGEQIEFCNGYLTLGPELSYEFFAEGYGSDAPSLDSFSDFFSAQC